MVSHCFNENCVCINGNHMVRSFLPVGQGAFYKETFYINGEKHHVVYDCGSKNQKYVINAIDKEFPSEPKETIDAVFISHFHEDHFNGLEYLLNKCIVKNLYIPYLAEENKTIIRLVSFLQYGDTNNEIEEFLSNPNKWCQVRSGEQSPIIHRVMYSQEQERKTNDIISGTRIGAEALFRCQVSYFDWHFIPFNLHQAGNLQKITNQFNKYSIPNPFFAKDLYMYWCHYGADILKAYQDSDLDFNATSMVLFSGSNKMAWPRYSSRMCRCDSRNRMLEPDGCLYMGDFNAKDASSFKSLCDNFSNFLSSIGCLQVPHHGSLASFNKDLTEFNQYIPCYVISFGCGNQYKHPSSDVIKSLKEADGEIFLVNEIDNSRLDFLFEF